MKSFNQIFNLVSIDEINVTFDKMIMEHENERNEIRKNVLKQIESLDVKTEGETIQKLLLDMNKDLTSSYEKEIFLRSFIDTLLNR